MECFHPHCPNDEYMDGRCKLHHDLAWVAAGCPTPYARDWRHSDGQPLCKDCFEAKAEPGADICMICRYAKRNVA